MKPEVLQKANELSKSIRILKSDMEDVSCTKFPIRTICFETTSGNRFSVLEDYRDSVKEAYAQMLENDLIKLEKEFEGL